MTENQFELLIIYGGMMQEGMSPEEAKAIALQIMQYDPEDIEWLENRIRFQKKKITDQSQKIEEQEERIEEWIEQQQDPSHNQW